MNDYKQRPDPSPDDEDPDLQPEPVEEDLCDVDTAWDPEADEQAAAQKQATPQTPERDDAPTRLP